MTEPKDTEARNRGNIRQRGNSLQVRVYAGIDPVTGKPSYLAETVKGTDKAARKRAEKLLTKLQAQVDQQRSPTSSVSLSHAIDEWLRATDIEASTRHGYLGYIKRTIRPALDDVPINKLNARMLETLYGELRRCRVRCDGRPFIEHTTDEEHDCVEAKCRPHKCKPMAPSSVRQIHSILSGVLNAAARWDWISSNPAKVAQRPRQTPPQPEPPSAAEAARLVEKAFDLDESWGTLVWLAMTTGMRRGELCALRWSRVDLEEGIVNVRRAYTTLRGVGSEKDTKPTKCGASRSTPKPSSSCANTKSAAKSCSPPWNASGPRTAMSSPTPAATSTIPIRRTRSQTATRKWRLGLVSRPISTH